MNSYNANTKKYAILETLIDPDQLASLHDQDFHSFTLCLLIQSYKLGRSLVHKIASMLRVKGSCGSIYICLIRAV